ncbi:MAG: SPOR domain-containing protein [Sphingomonadales bacterium]
MAKGKKKTSKKTDDFDSIWFSGKNSKTQEEEKMPNFQFYDDNRRTFLVIGSIFAVFLFAGILWFLYYQKNIAGPEEIPFVAADRGPVKTKPAEPGGMVVPDQDKLIFDKVSGQETELPDQIQPGPEQPLGDLDGKSIEDLIRETEPEGTVVAAASPATEPAAAIEALYIIQLGAFGEEAAADRAWEILQDRYKTVIGSLTPDIQRATLSEGRVLYRLRAGFFADKEQAERACNRLKELGQDCLAIKR